jgi:hypothetical protein
VYDGVYQCVMKCLVRVVCVVSFQQRTTGALSLRECVVLYRGMLRGLIEGVCV